MYLRYGGTRGYVGTHGFVQVGTKTLNYLEVVESSTLVLVVAWQWRAVGRVSDRANEMPMPGQDFA